MRLSLIAIRPRKTLDDGSMPYNVRRAMRRAARAVLDDFKSTVATWRHEPSFILQEDLEAWTVATDSPIYRYVTQGTRPHTIRARRVRRGRRSRKWLAFPSRFTAKTSPGVVGSGHGYRGGAVAFAETVVHPGIEARRFVEAIVRKHRRKILVEVQEAIRESL